MVGIMLNLCVLNVYGNSATFTLCRDNIGIPSAHIIRVVGTKLVRRRHCGPI